MKIPARQESGIHDLHEKWIPLRHITGVRAQPGNFEILPKRINGDWGGAPKSPPQGFPCEIEYGCGRSLHDKQEENLWTSR